MLGHLCFVSLTSMPFTVMGFAAEKYTRCMYIISIEKYRTFLVKSLLLGKRYLYSYAHVQ
jgi:hypothetical protein